MRKTKRRKLIEVKRNHTEANEDYIARVAKNLGGLDKTEAQRLILTRAEKLQVYLNGND